LAEFHVIGLTGEKAQRL